MKRELWSREHAIVLWKQHPKVFTGWGPKPVLNLEIWLRDECRCTYCGMDFLQSRDIMYFFYHYDHLLPVSLYPNFADATWNKVLACHACNVLKGHFDPSADGIGRGEECRDSLIVRVRKYLEEKRQPLQTRFVDEVRLIKAELESYEREKTAHA